MIRDGRVADIELGLGPTDGARFYLNSHTLSSLADGSLSAEQSVQAGQVLIENDSDEDEQKYVRILQSLVATSSDVPVNMARRIHGGRCSEVQDDADHHASSTDLCPGEAVAPLTVDINALRTTPMV